MDPDSSEAGLGSSRADLLEALDPDLLDEEGLAFVPEEEAFQVDRLDEALEGHPEDPEAPIITA